MGFQFQAPQPAAATVVPPHPWTAPRRVCMLYLSNVPRRVGYPPQSVIHFPAEGLVEFEDVAETIELPDNSGRGRITLRPRRMSADSFIADITITLESFEPARGSELSLTAIPLSRTNFSRLNGLLANWLAEETPLEMALASERWAKFNFTVGPDAKYITSRQNRRFGLT